VTSNHSYLPSISNIWPLPNYTVWWQIQVSKYILTKFIYFQAIRAKSHLQRRRQWIFARGVCANISVCTIVNPTWVKTLLTSTWPHVRCYVGTEEGEHWKNCLCATVLCTITVWTVVETVLTATFNFYGNRQTSTPPPHKINPEPIDKKFGTIDYVCEGTSCTKFGRNPSPGGVRGKWVKHNKNYFYLLIIYTFFFDQPTDRSDPWMDFYMW